MRISPALVIFYVIPLGTQASTFELSDILSVDELGYECVAGEYFEEHDDQAALAFSVSEKIRLPRTCLPAPCDRALSQRELSNITGTEVVLARFSEEWDEYYARYADYCRKETVGTYASTSYPTNDVEFWQPLRAAPVQIAVNQPISTAPKTPRDEPFVSTGPSVFKNPKEPQTDGDVKSTDPERGKEEPDLTSVPVPPAGVLLATATLLFMRPKRKK